MESIQAFLKKYDHIPPNEKCMALLLAEERFLKIRQVMEKEQNQPRVMQELLLKLMDDLQILKGSQQEKEKTAAQRFTPYWNFSMIDDEEARENFMKDICTFLRKFSRIPFGVTPKVILIAFGKPTAITPDLPIKEPNNSLIMGDEYLDTIPSVENLDPTPSEFEGISEDTILSDSNNDDTSSDDDDLEDIEYVSLEEVNDFDQKEKEFDLEDILQIQDVILREKLLNISRLIINIESLNDNLTPNYVLKSPSSFPIPVTDSDSFFEESDTSFSHVDNSLPETFSNHTEEKRSGTYDPLLELPKFESFHFDLSSPRPPPEPPDVEICFNFKPDAPMINNFDALNEDECFYPEGGKINVSQNAEDDDSFALVIRTFFSFLTYLVDSPLLLSAGSEDTIFDPGIFT
ncbi:hypothetical protein Tco_0811792 [Tanacetum coccineum]